MSRVRAPLIGWFFRFADRLRFRQLFFLTAALFLLDLLVPDVIPLLDELILGLLTLLFANWKKSAGSPAAEPGTERTVGVAAPRRRLDKPAKRR
jgi:hypothetical protein